METTRRCPACRARIAAAVIICPACGARLKKGSKAPSAEGSREAPADPDYKRPKKKKKKKEKSGPNYPLFAGIGGGVLVIGIVVWLATIGIKEHRESTAEVARRADANKAGGPGPEVVPAPVWTAKADPPKGEVRPKDDLAIPIEGEPLFASGLSPFVVDLVAVRSGVADPPKISVYDVRTGERTQTANALQHAQSPGRERNSDFYVALGPDGKTLAARTKTTTGTGRKAQTTSEVLIYRLGKDEPVSRIPVPVHLSWMEFGRDENQLIVISAPTNTNISATAYDLKKPGAPQIPLRTQGTWVRWRDGGFHPDAWVVSPGRNYLAAGGGRAVDLIQLSDGQSVASLPLPGDCVSVAFSPDGKELTAHSSIAPPKRGGRGVPTQHQWTTFSLADGKQVAQTQVTGGPVPGTILAAGPKPGLAVHGDGKQAVVTDTRIGAPVYTTSFPATRCIDDRLIGYDASAKRVAVQRIDPERLAAGEKELARIFGPRPDPDKADVTALTRPTAPTTWTVPIDPVPDAPALTDSYSAPAGADFAMPWAGKSALSAVIVERSDTPRDHYPLQWQRIDLASGQAEPPVELWPSLLPPGQVPAPAGSGAIVADQTADGSRLALKDAANPARVDVWDKSGKRLLGFLPYGPGGTVDALVWVADNRLLTFGGGRITAWEVPGPKAVFEVAGYSGASLLSPGRKWIVVQTEKYIDLFDTANGKPLGRLPQANPENKPWHAFAVSRDGAQLAAVELVRPGILGYMVWDLKTGAKQQGDRLFTAAGNRVPHVMWVGPRMLLAGGADVIDLDLRLVTATFSPNLARPLPSPDGRYWTVRSDQRPATEKRAAVSLSVVTATRLDDALQAIPRLKPEDIVLREGVAVEPASNTGIAAKDATIRSILKQQLAGEGYATDRGQWKLEVTAERKGGSGYLETLNGGKIQIPFISGWARLYDPGGAEAWKGPLSGGWDMNQSKYKTSKETIGPPGSPAGGTVITHFSFGGRDPQEAMAEEAWDNFLGSLKAGLQMPRVMARVNGKLEALPLAVPLAGK